MRYSSNHKAETRQRIIGEASRRFRKDGIEGTGLVPLMKALGLTHGGFYAHFESKDALVQASLEAAASPEAGDWLYFVTVNLDTGETVFSATYAEQQAAEATYRQWCEDNPDRGCY